MKKCSKCREPHDRSGQGYCLACHAAYMRDWRPAYSDFTAEQKMKDIARSAAGVALRRGKIQRQACEHIDPQKGRCDAFAEMHHPDYSKPLEVMWLCVPHHGDEHKRLKEIENGELLQATG